ncbi:MAG TPA: hypothetical protein PK450_05765, partial [Paracoccaceae bacterium]|nr:hypothetical protein [Paracoccaceae bacterium]
PLAFVAIPEPGRFAGEPFFGLTGSAERWLDTGTRYDRDQDPVRVVAVAPPVSAPEPAPPPPSPVEPEVAEEVSYAAPLAEPQVPSDQDLPDPLGVGHLAETIAAEVVMTESESEEAPFIDLSSAETEEVDLPASTTADPVTHDAPQSADDTAPEEASPAPDVIADPAPVVATDEEVGTSFQSRRQPVDQTEEPGARLADIVPRLGGMGAVANAAMTGSAQSRALPPAVERIASRIAQTSGHVSQPRAGTANKGLVGSLSMPDIAPANLDLPRLAAGAIAMLLLAAALFWAFLSNDDSPATSETPPVAALESAAPQTVATSSAPAAETTVAATEETALEPAPDPAAGLAQPTVDATAPSEQSALPTGEGSALSAALGEAGVPHPGTATGLPDPASLSSDLPLVGQPLPQPFGTLLRYDANGLIVATPEGVVTPGGFTLVAGQPARLPRPRPAGLVPAPAPVLPATAAATVLPFADPALADKRPRARPADLTPPPAATTPADETNLGPLAPPADSRHAAMKPKARPAAVAAAAAARRAQDEAVADAAASAARAEAEAAAAAIAAASPQAVATSRRPQPRTAAAVAAAAAARVAEATAAQPTVDTAAVDAALAEAQTAPEPEAAAPAPEPDPPAAEVEEPEPEEGIATLPTTRTVAKKSTYANAIDLGDVNLIGVYGSSSNRRALVRMPNGRFVKVKVGDRLDGGKVAAIGDAELRYVKKGKTVVLKIMKNG